MARLLLMAAALAEAQASLFDGAEWEDDGRGEVPAYTLDTDPAPFRFAGAVGSGAVLQSAPSRAMVWGFCPEGSTVTVSFGGEKLSATIGPDQAEGMNTTWRVLLPATPASFDNHTITASLEGGETITLEGVMFGEVWVCSGQSNMQYPLAFRGKAGCWNESNINCTVRNTAQCKYGCVNHSAVEIAALPQYDEGMRVLTVGKSQSNTSRPDVSTRGWRTPSQIGAGLSAVCWFFGRDVYNRLTPRVPVGLITTDVGGTPDQHWSSPDAISKCVGDKPWDWKPGFKDSVFWNGMVVGLLRTVVRGAVWYQGEGNRWWDGRQYNCSFPAMINDWRAKWHAATDGATDVTFPFGWVQLNSNGEAEQYVNPKLNSTYGTYGEWAPGFPSIRLAQSSALSLEKSFQAVILDTPVASGSTHSPYKQPVGQRLARGALATAYGEKEAASVYPVGVSAALKGGNVVVKLGGLGKSTTAGKGREGFEVLGGDGVWHSTPIIALDGGAVEVGPAPSAPRAVRYLWYDSPCGSNQPYQCPVYTSVEPLGGLSGEGQPFLPLGPFLLPVS